MATPTQQNNIVVNSLQTAEQFFDHFEVEMHNGFPMSGGTATVVSGSPNVATLTFNEVGNAIIYAGDTINVINATSSTIDGQWTLLTAVLATGVWTVTFDTTASAFSSAPQSAGTFLDRVGFGTSKGTYDGIEYYTQSELISFPMAYQGQTYYFRTRIIDLAGNQSAWSSWETATAAATTGVSAPSFADPVIHGDSLWEIDPALCEWRDDFNFHGISPGVGGTSTLGDLKWDSGGAGSTPFPINGIFPHIGQIGIQNTSTANQYFWMVGPPADTTIGQGYRLPAMPLLGNPGWKVIFVFNLASVPFATTAALTQRSLYIGLTNAGNAGGTNIWSPISPTNPPRPPYFLGVRFDQDTTSPSINDTTLMLEAVANYNTAPTTRNNTQGTTFNTGITPAIAGNWCALEIECTAAGVVTMSVTDDAVTSLCPRTNAQSFTLPKMQCTAGASSSSWEFQGSNAPTGYMDIFQSVQGTGTGTTETNFGVWSTGTQITIANLTSTLAVYNGTYIAQLSGSGAGLWIPTGLSATGTANSTATITGYPALLPCFIFGNDSAASPTANCAMYIDFFGMIINPGVGGGTGTPNPLKSRYW